MGAISVHSLIRYFEKNLVLIMAFTFSQTHKSEIFFFAHIVRGTLTCSSFIFYLKNSVRSAERRCQAAQVVLNQFLNSSLHFLVVVPRFPNLFHTSYILKCHSLTTFIISLFQCSDNTESLTALSLYCWSLVSSSSSASSCWMVLEKRSNLYRNFMSW